MCLQKSSEGWKWWCSWHWVQKSIPGACSGDRKRSVGKCRTARGRYNQLWRCCRVVTSNTRWKLLAKYYRAIQPCHVGSDTPVHTVLWSCGCCNCTNGVYYKNCCLFYNVLLQKPKCDAVNAECILFAASLLMPKPAENIKIPLTSHTQQKWNSISVSTAQSDQNFSCFTR